MIPEELRPPPEIKATVAHLREAPPAPDFVAAVVDPLTNALVCAAGVVRSRVSEAIRKERCSLVRIALLQGPSTLNDVQRMRIVDDPVALSQLHASVWAGDEAHAEWRAALGA